MCSLGLKENDQKDKDMVVFIVRRNTACAECGKELVSSSWIYLEKNRPLCLSCADLDHLEFLASGGAVLTRRAKKYSKLFAVVVKWSRTRKRYERQGILVEDKAIEKAEEECFKDADLREARRQREQICREVLDQTYIKGFAREIRKRYPHCSDSEECKIAQHACRKYSGRVGRSSAAKSFDSHAIGLAVKAHIRHNFSDYDELLMNGWSRTDARERVYNKVEEILNKWTDAGEVNNGDILD